VREHQHTYIYIYIYVYIYIYNCCGVFSNFPHTQISSPLLTRSPGFSVKPPLSGCPKPAFPRIPTHTVYPRLFCRLKLRPVASPATVKNTNSSVTAIFVSSSLRTMSLHLMLIYVYIHTPAIHMDNASVCYRLLITVISSINSICFLDNLKCL
jgi:hypothetical protein